MSEETRTDEAVDTETPETPEEEIPEVEEEFDYEELPEPEAEAEEPEGDLRTALQEARQQMLEERQSGMAFRGEAERLIRGLREQLQGQRPRQRPEEDEDPWNEHQEQTTAEPQGDAAVARQISELRREIQGMKSESQQRDMRSNIENAMGAQNERLGMEAVSFPDVVYLMQQNPGMTAEAAARTVARTEVAKLRDAGYVRRTPKEAAPDLPGGLRRQHNYTLPKEPAKDREGLERDIDAFLDGLEE